MLAVSMDGHKLEPFVIFKGMLCLIVAVLFNRVSVTINPIVEASRTGRIRRREQSAQDIPFGAWRLAWWLVLARCADRAGG